jgi:hypothetical protein
MGTEIPGDIEAVAIGVEQFTPFLGTEPVAESSQG